MSDGLAGRRLSSVSLNSACSSILSHGTCASMTTQVGSAVAKYGAYSRLGVTDHGAAFGSLDRSAAWDSLGRHSTISGRLLPTHKCTKHQFIYLLTATLKNSHIENSKNHKKVILFSSTLTHSQCDADNITFCDYCCFRCASSSMLPLTSV